MTPSGAYGDTPPPQPAMPPLLVQRWVFLSPCKTVDELAQLYAPYWSGSSLYLFSTDLVETGTRVELEVILADGACVLSGNATVTESHDASSAPYGNAGMRFTLDSIADVDSGLLEALTRAEGTTPEGDASLDIKTTRLMTPLARDDRTQRISANELVGLLNPETPDLSSLLECRVSVSFSGECEVTGKKVPHVTRRSVVTDLMCDPKDGPNPDADRVTHRAPYRPPLRPLPLPSRTTTQEMLASCRRPELWMWLIAAAVMTFVALMFLAFAS